MQELKVKEMMFKIHQENQKKKGKSNPLMVRESMFSCYKKELKLEEIQAEIEKTQD